MATLSIKDDEVWQLAKQLAKRTGTTMTGAVKRALRQQLRREALNEGNASRGCDHIVARVLERARRTAALPMLDARTAEEILGYDTDGIPQ